MTQKELNILLDEHEKWLKNRSQGKQLMLKDINLRGFNISKRKLISSILENVDLSVSNCEDVTFYGDTNLKNVKFCGANLKQAEFTDAILENVDFTNANLEMAEMMGFVIAKRLKFDNATMDKALLIKSHIRYSSFKETSLVGASFKGSDVWDCDFENANCTKADLTYANFVNVEAKGAKIEGADFTEAKDLPEEWKQLLGWYSEEQQNIRRIKAYLKENSIR